MKAGGRALYDDQCLGRFSVYGASSMVTYMKSTRRSGTFSYLCYKYFHGLNGYSPVILSIKVLYLTTLCLSATLSCVDFMVVIMGDIPNYYWE